MVKVRIQNLIPQLNSKELNVLFSLSLFMLAMAAFLFLGADGYVLFDDSESYIDFYQYAEGVMPLYPVFLYGNRLLFGEAIYLNFVIIEQALFASLCILIFVQLIKKQFELRYWECYCIFLLALLPFTTDMPDAMTTQEILTEGITYAAFYLFMAVLLKAVWTKRIRWIGALMGTTFFLAVTRSQLQMLFGVCGIIFFYIILMRPHKSQRKNWIQRILIGIAGCIVISVLGVWCIGRVSPIYRRFLQDDLPFMKAEEQTVEEETIVNDENPQASASISGQYLTLIFARAMYEADYEDYQLFEDAVLRELYLYLYQTVDEGHNRYVYATPGLWMWQDISDGIGRIGTDCAYPQLEFYQSHPEIYNSNQYDAIRTNNLLQISLTLIKEHFGRVLYHAVLLLPQAFIFTVFFKIEEIYLLCHLITLFLYVSALVMMIWAYKDKKIDRAYGEFMAAVLGVNVFMVFVISLVFIGLQRYVVYNFGIFYIVYFLLLLQSWKVYGKNRLSIWHRKR